jgi:ring-1,2-phenylacetyl-CoA epoxidase subunit PaaC
MQSAIDDLWMYTGEMFTPDTTEIELIDAGIAADVRTLAAPWREQVDRVFAEATLSVPGETFMQQGGKHGAHTEHLGHLLAEMQVLQRAYPGASW